MAITDPNDIASLVAWYDAQDASSITDTAGDVTAVANKKIPLDTAWNLTVQGAGNEILTDGAANHNGHNVLDFQAGKYLTTSTVSNITQPNTIIALIKYNSTSDFAFGGITAGSKHEALRSGGGAFQAGAGTTITQNTVTGDALMRTHVIVFNTTSSRYIIDGTVATPDGSLSMGTNASMGATLGANDAGSFQLDGEIAEWMFFDEELIQADIDDVEAYLTARWAAGNIIALTSEPVGERVYQRNSGVSRAITIAGTYTGDVPASVEYRAVQDGTSIGTQDWALLDASPGGGTFTGNVTFDDVGKQMVNVEVRYSDDTATTATGNNTFGVGFTMPVGGQSLGRGLFTEGTAITPDDSIRFYDGVNGGTANEVWFDPANSSGIGITNNTGNGAITLANFLSNKLNTVVGLMNSASSGVALVNNASAPNGYWGAGAGLRTPFIGFEADYSAYDSEAESILFVQGVTDARNGNSQADYLLSATNLYVEFRASITNRSSEATLPIFTAQVGFDDAISVGGGDNVNDIQLAINDINALTGNFFGGQRADLETIDGVHLTPDSFTRVGNRHGAMIANTFGALSYGRGPQVSSVNKIADDELVVNFPLVGGTDYTFLLSSIEGFEVAREDGTTVIPITTVSQLSPTSALVKLAENIPEGEQANLRYLWGSQPNQTSPIWDNTVEQLPLEVSYGYILSEFDTGSPTLTNPFSIGTNNGPLFTITTSDSLATIEGAGFFNDNPGYASLLKTDDVVIIQAINGTKMYTVTVDKEQRIISLSTGLVIV